MYKFLTGLPITVRYLIAGGTSTAIDLVILYILTEFFGWWYLASATVAFVVAVVVSFVLQKFYTFNNSDISQKTVAAQSTLYLALQITNIGINTMLMYALVEWAGVWYFFAQIIAAAAIAVESFFVYRFIIFHTTAPLAHRAAQAVAVLRFHHVALSVAVVVSLLYGLHHFLMPQFMPEGFVYKPITYESDHDAGGYYGPRANAFFSRNQLDSPSFLPILNPLIIGGLGKLLGSMERAYIVSDFLFPPLIFLAVYALAREILYRRLPSLILASIFIVSPLAALFIPPFNAATLHNFFTEWFPAFREPALLHFSSFEYPKITFLFYVCALFFIFRAVARGGRKNILLAGLFFGSLFYTYLYDWAYITVSLFIMLVWFALRREWNTAKSCAGIFGIGALVSIPYWLNFAALRRLPQYQDIIFRIGGLEVGRSFRFSSVWKTYARHIVWIGALAVTSLRRIPRAVIFLIALLAAYFVVVNVQAVLGFSPQPDHWYRETFLPVLLSLGVVGVWTWDRFLSARISRKTVRISCSIFLVLFFAQAFYMQYSLSRNDSVVWGVERRYADAYAWLAEHTEADSVVGSISEATNRDILLFSHNSLFLPSGGTTLMSNEEIWQRFYVLALAWEWSPEQLSNFVQKNSYYFFQDYYRSSAIDSYFKTTHLQLIPEDELAIHMSEFVETQQDSTHSIQYRLDYLFVGPREEAILRVPASFAKLPLAYNADGVRIYRINHERKR